MMLTMASDFPEYAESAGRCRIVETPAVDFYGVGYQDVRNRLPYHLDHGRVAVAAQDRHDHGVAPHIRVLSRPRGRGAGPARSGRLGLLAVALIALKVDVDTLRGTQEGVPRLLRLLERAGVRATFLFSVGPDHTGWALRRALRRGSRPRCHGPRSSHLRDAQSRPYGLLPARPRHRQGLRRSRCDRRCAPVTSAACTPGHHVLWQDKVRHRDAAWTVRQMELAFDRFVDVFGEPPRRRMGTNAEAFRQIDIAGVYVDRPSDGRGSGPFVPVVEGVALHAQFPDHAADVDELIGCDADRRRQRGAPPAGPHRPGRQVHTLHAELEGRGAGVGVGAVSAAGKTRAIALAPWTTPIVRSTLDPSPGKRWTGQRAGTERPGRHRRGLRIV